MSRRKAPNSSVLRNINEESPLEVQRWINANPGRINDLFIDPNTGKHTTLRDKAEAVWSNYTSPNESRRSPFARRILEMITGAGGRTAAEIFAEQRRGALPRISAEGYGEDIPEAVRLMDMYRRNPEMLMGTPTPRAAPTGYSNVGLQAPHTTMRNAIVHGDLAAVKAWLAAHRDLLAAEPVWWDRILAYATDLADIPQENTSPNTAARIVREIKMQMPRANAPLPAPVLQPLVRLPRGPPRLPPSLPRGGSKRRRRSGRTRKNRRAH